MEKVCTRCGVTKPQDAFGNRTAAPDGKKPHCRDCINAYERERFHRNPEITKQRTARAYQRDRDKLKAKRDAFKAANPPKERKSTRICSDKERYVRKLQQRKETYQRHKAKVLAVSAAYRAKHKEQERANRKAHYERNKARVLAVCKAYRLANKPMYAKAATKRRASKLRAQPKWADERAIQEMYDLAQWLTENSGIPHHVDHVVPLQSKKVCGLHCEANLTLLPASDNLSKSNRYWPDMF